MASPGSGGWFEADDPMANPHPNSPALTTAVPTGAVAARAEPRVRAVLSPNTTTVAGRRAAGGDTNLVTLTAATVVAAVPASTTTTVAATSAAAGAMARGDLQNLPSMTGRSMRE